MADVTETYSLNFETNAQKATGLVSELEKTLSAMGDSGELATKGLNSASRGVLSIEKALGTSRQSVQKYSDSFSDLRKEVSKATEALQEAAQAYVVGGGTDVLGAAANTMNLGEAKEILAVQKAEGLTAEQVAAEVVAANKRKEQAQKAYEDAMRAGLARLERIQKDRTDEQNAAELRHHNQKMERLQEEVRRETAAVEKIQAERAKLNQENAKAFQQGFTDPKSFFGQANSRDASTGLKASETSWAKAAIAQQGFRAELNKTEISFQEQSRAAELSALKTQILARYTDEAEASTKNLGGSLPTLRYALYDVAQTAGMMSAAITATGAGLLAASSSYESSFTAVERTSGVTGQAVTRLREDLLDLSRTIPQSFGDITDLAARGAQLGVADTALASFTETVAQFVATSDTVTMDQAVEAFGRVSNLLGDTDFNRIGSAITLVGVNAAATEGQIVKTTQELAPFAAAIGMSSDEVIGLATALASLGQPPERARSAFLSLQSVMEKAISGMNDKLPAFASLLNTSADEVENLWKTDPGAFIQSFVDALAKTENLTVALGDLGLSEKRATQVFQALAADSANAGDGLSVLTQAFQDSEKGYREGTELARQYGLIVDDLASKWQLFINSVQEVAAALGDTLAPAAKVALDFLTNMLQGIAEVSRNPFAKWVHGISLAVVGLGGVFLALVASSALAVASMAAFKTALDQAAISSGTNMLSIRGLNAALTQTAVAAGVSSRALTGFKVALASTGIGLVVVALGTLAAAFMNAGQSAEQAFESYVGSTGGLSEALAADQLAYQEALATGNTELADQFIQIGSAAKEAASGTDENSRAMQDAADLLGVTLEASETVTGAIEEQTAVMGENTLAWLNNSLVQSEAFQALAANQDFVDSWEEFGLSLQDVIQAAADGGEQGVLDLFTRMGNSVNNGAGVFASGFASFFIRIVDTWNYYWDQFAGQVSESWDALWSGNFKSLASIRNKYADSLSAGVGGIWTNPVIDIGVRDFAKSAAGAVNTSRELDKAARNAGRGMVEAGEGGEEGGAGVGGFGDNAGRAAEKVRTLVDYANDLSSVWKRAFDIRFSGQSSFDAIQDSFQKIRDAAEASAKRVRDLKDSIKSLTADKGSLQAEIGTLEYFLKVARAYGDSKRASELEAELAKKRAELSKKTSELAEKQKDLKKEQDSQNKSLEGNSKAARDNRQTITDLIQKYQEHIAKLAESGLSQDELRKKTEALKKQFIEEATQLGFNRQELNKYARAFDDVKVAIDKVPRNITVKANPNPALQALNEFAARARTAMSNAGTAAKNAFNNSARGIGSGLPRTVPGPQITFPPPIPWKSWDAFMKGNPLGGGTTDGFINWIKGIKAGYAEGGYTGAGGKYEPAGIVHKGEYVLRKDQVNQRTGLPYASALGQLMGGIQPTARPARSGASGGGMSGPVDLSAHTIQQLARVVQTNIMLDGRIVGEAASNSYAANTRVGAA